MMAEEKPSFSIEQERFPEGLVAVLKGDLTASGSEAWGQLTGLVPWPQTMLLDFSKVEYINSSGIALLISLVREARKHGGAVRARGLSEHYRKIFRMVGLSEHIQILG